MDLKFLIKFTFLIYIAQKKKENCISDFVYKLNPNTQGHSIVKLFIKLSLVVVSLNSNYDIRISHRMRFWFILLANATITHIFFWMNASCPYFLLTFSFAFITILLPYLHPKTVYITITVTGHLVSQFRLFSITYKT